MKDEFSHRNSLQEDILGMVSTGEQEGISAKELYEDWKEYPELEDLLLDLAKKKLLTYDATQHRFYITPRGDEILWRIVDNTFDQEREVLTQLLSAGSDGLAIQELSISSGSPESLTSILEGLFEDGLLLVKGAESIYTITDRGRAELESMQVAINDEVTSNQPQSKRSYFFAFLPFTLIAFVGLLYWMNNYEEESNLAPVRADSELSDWGKMMDSIEREDVRKTFAPIDSVLKGNPNSDF